MTPSREIALFSHWKKYPPVHKLAAAYMGFKPPEIGKIEDLVGELGNG